MLLPDLRSLWSSSRLWLNAINEPSCYSLLAIWYCFSMLSDWTFHSCSALDVHYFRIRFCGRTLVLEFLSCNCMSAWSIFSFFLSTFCFRSWVYLWVGGSRFKPSWNESVHVKISIKCIKICPESMETPCEIQQHPFVFCLPSYFKLPIYHSLGLLVSYWSTGWYY